MSLTYRVKCDEPACIMATDVTVKHGLQNNVYSIDLPSGWTQRSPITNAFNFLQVKHVCPLHPQPLSPQ